LHTQKEAGTGGTPRFPLLLPAGYQ
jgi:hypothetical protein